MLLALQIWLGLITGALAIAVLVGALKSRHEAEESAKTAARRKAA